MLMGIFWRSMAATSSVKEFQVKQQYVIGIDGGTQSSKVVIYDLSGTPICQGVQKLKPLHMPVPGVAEHPDDDLWESIAAACQQAMQQFPFDHDSLLGVGLCTIRCCRVALDKDGELVGPALNWMDERVGQVVSWDDSRVQYQTTSSGYIGCRLTGEKKDTAANYEGQWPIDKLTWQWSENPKIRKRYQLEPDNLFELVMPGDVIGHITTVASAKTGLPAGLPVVATANDKAVEALGAGLAESATALISLGTYIGGMVTAEQHSEQAEHYFSNLACIPHRYLYECGGVRHGMGTISWLRDLFGDSLLTEAAELGLSAEELLNQEALQIPVGSEGLITLPEWLAPYDQPHKSGVMIGLTPRHGRAHLYRSLLEAVAMTMRNHLADMANETGQAIEAVVISGGGSNSDVFMQIFADVLALPCRRNHVSDAASLGAAMCVAVASGHFASFDQAMSSMVKPADRFAPNPTNSELYQTLNQRVFVKLRQHADPILYNLHSILN